MGLARNVIVWSSHCIKTKFQQVDPSHSPFDCLLFFDSLRGLLVTVNGQSVTRSFAYEWISMSKCHPKARKRRTDKLVSLQGRARSSLSITCYAFVPDTTLLQTN